MTTKQLKVAGKSSVKGIAGSICKSFEEASRVEIICVGAGSVNQAIKGIATARGFLAIKGKDLVCRPGFCEVEIEGEKNTAIVLALVLQ